MSGSEIKAQNPSDEIDEFVKAVKEGGEEGLKKAFGILSKGALTIRVDDFKRAVTTRGAQAPLFEKAQGTIQQVTKQGEFNYREFVRMIKLLEEAGEAGQTTEKIYKKLKAAGEGEAITLCGEEGVGKTWMARQVAALALRDDLFDAVIWVFLNRDYDEFSLQESIAYQLSVLAAFEESEAKDAKEKEKEKADEAKKKEKEKEKADEEKKKEEKEKEETGMKNVVDEQLKPRKRREAIINKAIKGKRRVLFILDSEGSRMKANVSKKEQMNVVLELKGSSDQEKVGKVELQGLTSYKVMITRRTGKEATDDEIMVKPFTWEDSKALAARAMQRERVAEKYSIEAQELAHYFMFMSERLLPSQILLISKIVSYFAKEEEKGEKGEKGLKKLRDDKEMVKNGGDDVEVLDVLIKGYKKLPKSVLIDAYSPESPEGHFLRQGRKVNFNALICYWIMEGHLGHFDRVEDAYVEGHRVLMELMNCGLLQKQESDYVAPTGATRFHLDINDYKEFFSGIRPGLAVTFDMRLGRVALADGMIRTVGKSDNVISTLFLDGNRISEEESPVESLSKHKEEVEVLAINEPTSQHFKLPILEMRKLRLLALRGCLFLDKLDHFIWKKSEQVEKVAPKPEVNPGPSLAVEKLDPKPEVNPAPSPDRSVVAEKLESLTVLEISGPSFINTIPEQIFNLMPNLKTLNMSNLLKIELLPNSFYLLTQIEFLILRGCESLKELKSLKNFKDLKILDVSNATSFEKFEDKSLHTNTKLQILNLSNTKLKTLPLINQLKDLKFVWLRDCPVLPRIRKIDKMGNLQILDIAGAVEVERFCDPSLEDLKNLVIVDISRTAIKRLPANVGDPTYLYAKNCSKIRVVPPVEGLQKLQVLHLSGCGRLREIRHEFFEKVKSLRELDLSRTRVQNLPFLSSLTSLRRVCLSECESLEKLEKLSNLKDLEHLDLSGCKALMELEDGTFDEMIHLQYLDLSRTGIGGQPKQLPSLSRLKSLKTLLVRDCANLTKLPFVEQVPSLELLDYSGTVLESPPTFSNPEQPQPQVIGKGIESISITKLFKNLGSTTQHTTQQSGDEGPEWKFTHGEVSLCKWNISNWRIEEADKLGTPIYGAHFLRLLKEYPSFLEEDLSTFRFLVYPSEARLLKDFKASYIDELGLRDIYFEQVCVERMGKMTKMDRCLEIRGFKNLPTSLKPLVSRSQLVVLFDDSFLRSLPDLGIDRNMVMKACWIEKCNELEHVVAVPEKVEEPAETDEQKKTEGDQHKKAVAGKAGELTKKEDDQHKNNAAADAETTKGSQGDQQKNADAGKSGDASKNEVDEQKNDNAVAADAETTKGGQGDQQKNADAGKTEQKNDNAVAADAETTKGQDDQQKNADAGKSGDASKNEVDEQKNDNAVAADAETTKGGQGDQQKNADAGKTEQKNDNAVAADAETTKGQDDQQKNADAGKSGDASKNEVDEQKNDNAVAADVETTKGDQQKNADAGKTEQKNDNAVAADAETTKGQDDQPKNADAGKTEQKNDNAVAADAETTKGDQQKNADAGKSGDAAKNEVDEQKKDNAEKSGELAKSEGEQQKNGVEEKSGEPEKSEGDQPKNAAAEEKPEELAEQKNAEKTKELGKSELGDDQKKNDSTTTEKSKESAESEVADADKSQENEKTSELKNPAEDLDNLETLWISDASKLKSILKGDVQIISFKRLKSLYLEYCPDLSALTSSSSQLQSLETLHIKYCHNLKRLFADDNSPNNLDQLRSLQLWGLDSLEKVGVKAPLLRKLRVGQCPLLEHVITSRLTKEGEENEGHGTLSVLHIKWCAKLESICEPSSQKDAQLETYLERLTHLELWGLPKLQKVAAVPALCVLRVGDCPSLESIVGGGHGVPNLETMEVRSCERMRTIIGGGESELGKMKKIELLGLPELERLGAKLVGEVEGEVWACPKLEQLNLIPIQRTK